MEKEAICQTSQRHRDRGLERGRGSTHEPPFSSLRSLRDFCVAVVFLFVQVPMNMGRGCAVGVGLGVGVFGGRKNAN
jgi:hypothetical protein